MKKIKKQNGVNKNVVKNISHKEYIDVLFNKKIIRDKMKRIQSKLYKVGTYEVCRLLIKIRLYFITNNYTNEDFILDFVIYLVFIVFINSTNM